MEALLTLFHKSKPPNATNIRRKRQVDPGERNKGGKHQPNVVRTQTRTENIAESGSRGNFDGLRISTLDTLKAELTKYFPDEILYPAFAKLHPKYFDDNEIRARVFGIQQTEKLQNVLVFLRMQL